MQYLLNVFDHMVLALEELESCLQQENHLLASLRVNTIELQCVTDKKAQILATLAYYDQQRQAFEQQNQLSAPYEQVVDNDNTHDDLLDEQYQGVRHQWQAITTMTRDLSHLNRNNEILLNKQFEFTQRANQILQESHVIHIMGYDAQGKSDLQNVKRNILKRDI